MGCQKLTYPSFFSLVKVPYQKKGIPKKKCMRDYKYVFQFKDHLGNVRLSYSDNDGNGSIDATSEIIEESNYYPFGLKQKGYNNVISSNGNSLAQAFKFGGKELDESLGLNTYDFGARNYDAALGRWMNIDPLAHRYDNSTPYSYAFNSPIFFTDPDGMRVIAGRNEVEDRDLNTDEIIMLLASMQNMTDDQLSYNGDTGEFEIKEEGSGEKTEGTELIRDLIGHDNTMTLNYNVGKDGSGMPGGASGFDGDGDDPNFYNGEGGDTSVWIGVGMNYQAQDFETGEFSTETMTTTNLMNHEFTHALAQMNGDTRSKPSDNKPRGRMVWVYFTDSEGTKKEKIPLEEAYTVGLPGYNRPGSTKKAKYPSENSLNKEQKGKKRVNYGY